jgi:DNA-binding CsgD family transcriptional regulator
MSPAEQLPEQGSSPLPPPNGLSLEVIDLEGTEGWILCFPLCGESAHASNLSAAEREVAWGILHGLSYRQVAERRGVSRRTVANQVASIFGKLKVGSCLELALLMRDEPGW